MVANRSDVARHNSKPGDPLRPSRGLAIAAKGSIIAHGAGVFAVSSQSAQGASYSVELYEDGRAQCSCPDWKKRRRARNCKHGEAVVIALKNMNYRWDDAGQGEVLKLIDLSDEERASLELKPLYKQSRRNPSVPRVFANGNQHRAREKKAARIMPDRLPRILFELLETEKEQPRGGRGRPGFLLHQRAFCVLMRVFENRPLASVRRRLESLVSEGLTPRSVTENTLCAFMHDTALKPLFEKLLYRTARTVRAIEDSVILDSSSVSTLWSANYLDTGRGEKVYRPRNRWLKPHVAAGPITNVVSALEVTWNKRTNVGDEKNVTADVKFLVTLLRTTMRAGWNPVMLAADKGYWSNDNFRIPMQEFGIQSFIPFKSNIKYPKSKEAQIMLEFERDQPEEWDRKYTSIRPKIEGIFSAVKRTTGHSLRSRGETIPRDAADDKLLNIGPSRMNEMYAKFIIHNLRQIVMLECMLDDQVHFASDRAFQPFDDAEKLLEEARHHLEELEDVGDANEADQLDWG